MPTIPVDFKSAPQSCTVAPGQIRDLRRHQGEPLVTNRIAFWLMVVLAGASAADVILNDGQSLFFLARKFLNLIEWVAFWR